MLIDEVEISVKAGDGGDGAVSFRREKYVPKGGPDGGDGGWGGHVFFVATSSTHGLDRYRGKKSYRAEDGERGSDNRKFGKRGNDLRLTVPPGTRITILHDNGAEQILADLTEEGQEVRVARGGKGGKGNWHFRSSTNQTPREFEAGTSGDQKNVKLELQLIADVGLVGKPNAGKSTLLSKISNARPKIADYPFTTLEPNLGVVAIDDDQFVAADIPGLIEGASQGKGLGIEFLRHIQRTEVIVHLISVLEEDPETTYTTIRNELASFDSALINKPEIVVMSKVDMLPDWAEYHADFVAKHQVVGISTVSNTGITELLRAIVRLLATHSAE